MVRSVEVFLSQRVHPLAYLLLVRYRIGESEEPAAFVLIQRFGRSLDRQVAVGRSFHGLYFTPRKIRFHRMFAGKLFSLSSDSHTNDGLPTIWSSGTNPQ